MKSLYVAFGGALGAVSRYVISKFINSSFSFSFVPWGTIFVNVVGSFLLSFLMFLSISKTDISQTFILFFGTGFLGAFTTFSTFAYEFLSIFLTQPLRATVYFIANIFLGFFAAILGMFLGRGRIL
ncbi:CrcB protein [Thermosipho africanus Ob7]|jgi:CrcB protein|uniref:fluoride efflux transporter FluC n=1 Tax=Thermosipho africanus TaxID=2421 RepID=UPI000E0B2863|nr:CrcB family protein [Thermosipho africanus]RDI92584.1 CrcB protein [Thermosipho africanus Ob7]